MSIPVYINQVEVGQLRISQDGLYTVFEAEAKSSSALVRLWAHGNGKSAYLGVMQPWSGGLWLRRKLSALERKSFPDPIRYASDSKTSKEFTEVSLHKDNNPENQEIEDTKEDLHKNQDKSDIMEEKSDIDDLHNIYRTENDGTVGRMSESLHKTETDLHACPWPAELPEDGLLWYSCPDGSLVSFDGISSLVALPAEPGAKLPRAAERVIEGKKYLVFRY